MTATASNPETSLVAQQQQLENMPAIPGSVPAVPGVGGAFELLLNPKAFEHLQRVANLYSKSNLVPQQYRGNIADCFIALQMSMRLGVDPFMFLQSTYVIGGRPAMMAQLGIALMNRRGPFLGAVQFEMEKNPAGKIVSCTAWANHKNGQRCSATVTWEVVEAEGWSKRNGSKWLTMPEQMFKYRSAMWLARAYCPEVLMGMQSQEEAEDTYHQTRYLNAAPSSPVGSAAGGDASDLNHALAAEVVNTETGEVKTASTDGGGGSAAGSETAGPEKPVEGTSPAPAAAASEGAAPADPTAAAVAPTEVEKLAILMADVNMADQAACVARIAKAAKSLYKRAPEKMDAKQIAAVRSLISSGDLKP